NTIALKHTRSSTRGRPPRGSSGHSGSNGRTVSHSSSRTRQTEPATEHLPPRAGGRTCFALPGTPAIRVAARAVSSPGVTLDLARLLELRERLGNGRPAAPGSGCDLRRCQL